MVGQGVLGVDAGHNKGVAAMSTCSDINVAVQGVLGVDAGHNKLVAAMSHLR